MESGPKREKVLIVDGHGIAFQAFHAMPLLTAPDGTFTNAILGFMNILTRLEDEVAPSLCVVVFDAPGPTFRHEIFPAYKAQRKPAPEEFKPQIPLLKELLAVLGYPVIVREGVEADDVIASLARAIAAEGREALIVSSDKDLTQLLAPGIRMLRSVRGSTIYDEAAFTGEFGFPPPSMADYLALLGDSVDNVPGVAGVGEKTALPLIREYGTLERLYGALDEGAAEISGAAMKPALIKKLQTGRESAFASRELIYLRCALPVDLGSLARTPPRMEDAFRLCTHLGMTKLMNRLKKQFADSAGVTVQDQATAQTQATAQAQATDQTQITAQTASPAASDGADSADGCREFLDVTELLEMNELAIFLSRPGQKKPDRNRSVPDKYPPAAEDVELQLADERGRCAVWRGPDVTPDLLGRLAGKKLYMNDCKSLMACFGPGVFRECEIWDLKTAHYLLHPDVSSHALKDLYPGAEEVEKSPAALLWRAARELNLEIRRYEGLPELMERIDLPLIPVLVEMERRGIRLLPPIFADLQRELEERIAAIEREIATLAGEEVNLNSPRQVGWLLFERLGLPGGAKTKGKTALSTSAPVLESLVAMDLPHSDVPRLLLEHRELTKMLSGFVVPLQKAADDGFVHTMFEAAFTGTGRLSSRDPNLQNLPAFGHWSRRLKEGLIPSEPGRVFVAADYSQVELRVLAHLSGEERLRDAFRSGRDIHRETASWVFSTPPEEVTPELRRMAKMINFGLLYGMSSFGLADRLGIERGSAGRIIARYFAALPGVRDYLDGSAAEAEKRGYIRTLFGRIRPIAEAAEGTRDRGGLKRVAVNTPIQGTAADIARRAMIDFNAFFPPDGDVRLLLQIHDSLVCECPEERADEVGEALRRIMKAAATLSIPLEVELKKGRSLADV